MIEDLKLMFWATVVAAASAVWVTFALMVIVRTWRERGQWQGVCLTVFLVVYVVMIILGN